MPDLHVRPTRLDALGILRERTSLAHRRLEDRLDLLHVDTAQVRSVARRLDAFWAAGEPAVDAWARQETAMATALDWPRRRRFAPRSADPVDPIDPVVPVDPVDTATALGWLYVREGSTLGGAVIARHHPGLRLDTFTPYPEGPGPMWRRYVEVLQAWATGGHADPDADSDADTDADVTAAADAAVATFAALERSL